MAIVVDTSIESHASEVLDAMKTAKQAALEAIGLQAEGYAQLLAPVDTGRLRNSITHQVIDEESVAIGTNVEYAIYQELGTSKMKAQPYLRPAVVEHIDEYKEISEQAMKNA